MGQEQALASQMRGQALQAGLGYGRLGLGTREATAQEQLAQTQQRLQAEQLMEQGRRGRMEGVKTAIGGVGTFMSSLMGGMSDVQAKQAPSQPPPEERKFDWQKFGQMLAMEEPREEPQQTGGLGALAGGLTQLSDVDAKQAYQAGLRRGRGDLPAGEPAIERVMESVDPVSYEYKADPGTPRVGLKAQDLEKTPEGAAAVQKGPDGLRRVDPGQASLMAMAGAADLHDRLSKIEDLIEPKWERERERRGVPPREMERIKRRGMEVVAGEAEQEQRRAQEQAEISRLPASEIATLLASDDPSEQHRGRMMAISAAREQEQRQQAARVTTGVGEPSTQATLAQLGREQRAERRVPPAQRDVMSPAEIYAEDLRRFRLRQVRDGAEAMRPRPKPARDPVAEQIATTRGVPYSDVLAALGRTV
jgi:hypothetical protein